MREFIANIKYLNRKFIIWLIRHNAVSVLVAVLVIWISYEIISPDTPILDWFDFSVLSSIIFAFIVAILGNALSLFVDNKIEDRIKLTTDYETLTSGYIRKLYKYKNSVQENVSPKNLDVLYKKEGISKKQRNKKSYTVEFPVTYDAYTYNSEIKFVDSDNHYELPEIVENNMESLLKAHNTTIKYNQLMIRVDDWHWNESRDTFHVHTSRTTYIQSLLTNRAIDYELESGLSIRKLFDYGPLITPLKESKLSNHLGFNGFIESSDGYIPLVRRSSRVSIGKKTYAASVSASVKSKYVFEDMIEVNDNGSKNIIYNVEVNLNGIKNTIIKEIEDELKISPESLEWSDTKKHVFAWYRDMVEGGKPHFVFHIKVKESKETIEKNFKKAKKANKILYNLQTRMLEDADELIWIPKSKLTTIAISPEYIVYDKKAYKTLPSYSASLALLIDHLKKFKAL